MPVTLTIARHAPQTWPAEKASCVEDVFRHSFPDEYGSSQGIIQSSVSRREFRTNHISPSGNGFVWAAMHAYSGHHHLTIRPEDVWFAILSQVSFFFNAHPEELRKGNFTHNGRKQLEIEDKGSMEYSNFAVMSVRMSNLMVENSLAPGMRDWMMPDFSTTTDNDIVVALILMMGNLKKYFSYRMHKKCGIPSVTLLGERKDWEIILERVDMLWQFGSQHLPTPYRSEPSTFGKLLRPVILGFLKTFDAQASTAAMEFWGKIADNGLESCKPVDISGWISAFCFWDEDGKCLYNNRLGRFTSPESSRQGCVLEGVQYHTITTDKIPSGVVSLTVVVKDQGDTYRAKMLAGSLGIQATSSRGKREIDKPTHRDQSKHPESAHEDISLDTLQPLSGWLMSEIKPGSAQEDEAPLPKPFVYYDDFDAEAPLPAPFIYVENPEDSAESEASIDCDQKDTTYKDGREPNNLHPVVRTSTDELYE